MTFAGCTLEPVMVRGDIVVTDELAAYSSAAAMARLGDEPRMAVGKATDKEFIDLITAETGISSASSTGLDATQIVSDLQDALGAVDVGIASKLYIVLPGAVAKTLALIRDAGGWLFPELTPSGGSIQAFRPSSPTRLTTRSLYSTPLRLRRNKRQSPVDGGRETVLRLDDSVTSGETQLVSLWANDLSALRARRWFGRALLRSTGLAVISGLSRNVFRPELRPPWPSCGDFRGVLCVCVCVCIFRCVRCAVRHRQKPRSTWQKPPRKQRHTLERLAAEGRSGDVIAATLGINKNRLRAEHALDLQAGRETKWRRRRRPQLTR
jgi:hypothetical protein